MVCANGEGSKAMVRIITGLAVAALLAAGVARAQPTETVRARIESGVVVGVAYPNANVFKNIPFAAPPVGELRWAPPQPVKPWTAPRPAAQQGPSCPQTMNANDTPNAGGANGPMSEDCLQLNGSTMARTSRATAWSW
jgi:para-nitrobenzyl esterase